MDPRSEPLTKSEKPQNPAEPPEAGGTSRRTIVAAGLGALALATGVGAYLTLTPSNGPGPANAEPKLSELMKQGPLPENVIGAENAPVTIIEYSSMTCPHCANFHKEILPGLKEKYIDTGKVRYILREFPLDNLAAAAFMLARCSGPKKYFPLVEALYAKQQDWTSGEGNADDRLFEMAKQAGFSQESFEKCLKDQKLLDDIIAVRTRGSEKFGVKSTPTFFVNGKLLKGARNIKDFEDVMAPYLKG